MSGVAPPGGERAGDGERALVVAEIDGTQVALDAAVARGVARPEGFTRLPGAVAALHGLVAVHGKVAAVVDPRPALGLPPIDPGHVAATQLLVVSDASGRFALLVDDLDVVTASISVDPTGRRTTTGSDGASVPVVELHELVGAVLADAEPAVAEPAVAGDGT